LKSLLLLLGFILSFNSFAKAQVTETFSYGEVFPVIEDLGKTYGPSQVLVVFDIDDTLLVIEHCKKPDGSMTRGIGKFFHCASEHTEIELSTRIKKIQKDGFDTIALTARGLNLIKVTQRELAREHGSRAIFDFDGKPFRKDLQKIVVPRTRKCKRGEVAPCLTGKTTDKPRFLNGVMYAQGNHKGLALQRLLKELGASYKAIVFVDDRKKNTSNVYDAYRESSVEVEVFLYLLHRD